jgi:hypothetical protein
MTLGAMLGQTPEYVGFIPSPQQRYAAAKANPEKDPIYWALYK